MDAGYMKRALALAEKGIGKTNPNPLVGTVIVMDGRIMGEGWHQRRGEAHAEVNAVRDAGNKAANGTVYVNLEPCCHYGRTPPCTDLLIEKGVKRVVVGMLDPNPLVAGGGVRRLREAGIQVTVGVLEEECRKLNEVFIHYITKRKPFVVLKAAMSLDGKIAAPSGESKWITGEEARRDVQSLRNRYPAIMTGVGTVITDDPKLTCRLSGGRNPQRIILDSRLRIPKDSRVLADPSGDAAISAYTDRAPEEKVKCLEDMGARLLCCARKNGRIDLQDLMSKLGSLSIDSILLEGGATVNESAFSQGIVDKLILYAAPKIIGGETSKTVVGGVGICSLAQAWPLRIESVERVGEDLKLTAYRKEETGCLQESLKKSER